MKIIDNLIRCFYPDRCLICKNILEIERNRGICKNCEENTQGCKIRYIELSFQRENEIISEKVYCISAFYLTGKIKKMIYAYKFNEKTSYAELFASEMNIKLKKELPNAAADFDYVTYIPLSKKDKSKRGYDQSELICKKFSKYSGVKLKRLLAKVKDNKVQHQLTASQRQENVIGVYKAINEKFIKGKKIILCDDIVTTKSTLKEGCKELFKAGASEIICVTATTTEYKSKWE